MFRFTAPLCRFDDSPIYWVHHIPIPDVLLPALLEACPDKRVLCALQGAYQMHSALIPKGHFHYIMVNRDILKQLQLQTGDSVEVVLTPDTSLYGIAVCEEFLAVMESDPEAADCFEKLTPGKKRSLIQLINKVKNPDLRIRKSMVVLTHVQQRNGGLDFKALQLDFKKEAEQRGWLQLANRKNKFI